MDGRHPTEKGVAVMVKILAKEMASIKNSKKLVQKAKHKRHKYLELLCEFTILKVEDDHYK